MQLTILFIVFSAKKLMKSLWSVIGLCSCSGKESTAYGFTTVPFCELRGRNVVDQTDLELRDRLEAVGAAAVGLDEGHVGAVVGTVDVLTVPAALEVGRTDHRLPCGADRVLVLQLHLVLEAGAAPVDVGVARCR